MLESFPSVSFAHVGKMHSVASDKGKQAGKPLGTGKVKRAVMKSLKKDKEDRPCRERQGTVAFSLAEPLSTVTKNK